MSVALWILAVTFAVSLLWLAVLLRSQERVTKAAEAAANWPVVRGHVIKAGTVWVSDTLDGGGFNKAALSYGYEVEGKSYTSERIHTDTDKFYGVDDVLARYPTGSEVAVHYDPADPKTAVLEVGAASSTSKQLGIAGAAVFMGGGVLAAIAWVMIAE